MTIVRMVPQSSSRMGLRCFMRGIPAIHTRSFTSVIFIACALAIAIDESSSVVLCSLNGACCCFGPSIGGRRWCMCIATACESVIEHEWRWCCCAAAASIHEHRLSSSSAAAFQRVVDSTSRRLERLPKRMDWVHSWRCCYVDLATFDGLLSLLSLCC